MCSITVSGGGGSLAQLLLSVPGCSNTLLDLQIPYCKAATDELLGWEPEKYVSEATARDLAAHAFHRALRLAADPAAAVYGLGVTCALVSAEPRRGEHKVVVGRHDRAGSRTYTLVLEKGARTREEEDRVAGLLALRAMAEASGLDPSGLDLGLRGQEEVAVRSTENLLQRVVDGELEGCVVNADGTQSPLSALTEGMVVLPGSFNPVHAGHVDLSRAACELARVDAKTHFAYELSITNADKGTLKGLDAHRRVRQFQGLGAKLIVTRAPLFLQKAALLPPRTTFCVGYDTAVRLVDPKYADLAQVLAGLRGRQTTVIVAGRLALDKDKIPDKNQSFLTLADLALPAGAEGLFQGLTEHQFRSDLSSSQLRAQPQQKTD
jgi:hypothetical protein